MIQHILNGQSLPVIILVDISKITWLANHSVCLQFQLCDRGSTRGPCFKAESSLQVRVRALCRMSFPLSHSSFLSPSSCHYDNKAEMQKKVDFAFFLLVWNVPADLFSMLRWFSLSRVIFKWRCIVLWTLCPNKKAFKAVHVLFHKIIHSPL